MLGIMSFTNRESCHLFNKFFTFFLYLIPFLVYNYISCQPHSKSGIQDVANRFGAQMLNIGYEGSCFAAIREKFQKHSSQVKKRNPEDVMKKMRANLTTMMETKQRAVEQIAIRSEKIASEYNYENGPGDYEGYYNMKFIYDPRYRQPSAEPADGTSQLKSLPLSAHPNFDDSEVNLDFSAVHVPINVYEKAVDILNDIKWSENLTDTFKSNLLKDASLSWQFFGSSKGFIRIYPATKWKQPHDPHGHSKSPTPDLYDCRVRQWYIQTAASPKDIVILLDISGSMTGLRRHIALNVVYNILDTLNEDDFVLVMKFNNEVKFITTCMDRMVQATKRNINEIKESLDTIKTFDIANFTAAFIAGFDTLNDFAREGKGASCNKAIMLITDGAPETYEAVFQSHNPDKSIRVFTYVIGREVTQINEVYWMACNNRGYYAQVANLAEVREQVQQYIPVMSRPLVLSGERIYIWSPVYTAISEIQLTDWIWEERVKAFKTSILSRQNARDMRDENIVIDNPEEEKKDEENSPVSNPDEVPPEDFSEGSNSPDLPKNLFNIELEMAKRPERKKKVQLMTTVSTPVYDNRKFINVTKKILFKNVYKDSDPEPIRIANLLGVAGTDVPIREIEKMAPQHQLGVNGYSFLLTNNGKIVYHPDFRPIFQDMLKPFYSSVDFTEVELGNHTTTSRTFDSTIEQIRAEMINGSLGYKKHTSKSFLDSMKRPTLRTQHYIYQKVDGTPFSFAIVLPEPYGLYHFGAQVNLKNQPRESLEDISRRIFSDKQWRIHPDWFYCDNPHKISGLMPKTPEENLFQFFADDLIKNNYRWTDDDNVNHQNYTCDKDLLQGLIFDALNTYPFNECSKLSAFSHKLKRRDDKGIKVVNAFVSTRSGLTRFTDPTFSYEKSKNKSETEYSQLTRSVDEVYYKRAVDFYHIDNKAFVYSVPFDAASQKEADIRVTSSHAIFVNNGAAASTPVAVIGLQYNYLSFKSAFFDIANEPLKCKADGVECFVLDNNAFIILSSSKQSHKQVGKFFGEINFELLQDMVRAGIYTKIHFYDYQAICIDIINPASSSTSFITPFTYLRRIFTWLTSKLVSFYLNLFYQSWMVSLEESDYAEEYSDQTDMYETKFNKSRPKTCDREFDLYELKSFSEHTNASWHNCTEACSRPYLVQRIPHSNLIVLTLNKKCDCPTSSFKLEPKQVPYNAEEMCASFRLESLRKRPEKCFENHPKESEVKYCGGSAKLESLVLAYLLLLGLAWTQHNFW